MSEESVRKVAKYLDDTFYNEENMDCYEHARKIVDIVHEVEDADE